MRKFLKIGGTLLGAALLLAGLAWGGFQAMTLHFNPAPPRADYPRPRSLLEAQRQDLDYFARLQAMDHAYSPTARAQMAREIAAMKAAPVALAPQMFQVRLMQISALADNGHTHMRLLGPGRILHVLPVRVTRFAEGFYVMEAKAEGRDLLGGRLESIDGVPFDTVLAKLRTLRGGTEAFRTENSPLFIVVQDLLYGLGIAKDPAKSAWTVTLPSGASVTRTLTAYTMPKSDPLPYGFRWTWPEPMKGMGDGWTAYAPASGHLPESRQDLDRVFENLVIPGSCARYIRMQDITDVDDQKIAPALAKFEAELKASPPCAAIVDLRGNGGGDYTNAWHFSHALPSLIQPRGRIFVLTDPDTFSAAITTAAFIKQAGGDRVTILGEPIGDRLAFYAEGNSGCLPNSKLCDTYETGKHVYNGPCTDVSECFWLNWFYPVRVKTLEPDEIIPQRFSDWNAGHDVAFERAVELARM
ncbi:MAG: hypothetical protein ACREHE_03595 [Rhizomicrobium sp.]